MAELDYEAMASRGFDVGFSRDDRIALAVWADALESAGDWRGALITMELAVHAQPARSRELARAMTAHVASYGSALVGTLAPILAYPRTLELDWRAGRLYGARLDVRYAPNQLVVSERAVVESLLAAPIAASLRRLHVRARTTREVDAIVDAIVGAPRRPPLEQLVVLIGVQPTRFGVRPERTGIGLDESYPQLWLLATTTSVHPLPADKPTARDVPEDRTGRVRIGRALLHPDPEIRSAALERISRLRDSGFAFVDALMVLLRPGLVDDQQPIVACLARLGERAHVARRLLAQITGRSDAYDPETRRAAGLALAAIDVSVGPTGTVPSSDSE